MKISVVIPLYNKKDTIIRTLNSVLKQQVLPDEIIVINDGSTDGSENEVDNLNHSLITLVNQKNKGVSAARNKGIEIATSEWIAFLDADDLWEREYLREIMKLAKLYCHCNVLATSYSLKNYLGSSNSITLNKILFKEPTGILTNYFEVASCSHPPLWSSAIVVKKSSLLGIGGFPIGIKSGEDLLTWARLAVNNKIAYSLKELSIFIQDVQHSKIGKPSRIPDSNDTVGKELIKLVNRNKEPIKYLNQYISHWFKIRAVVFLRLNLRGNCFKECIKSLNYNLKNYKVYLYLIMLIMPLKLNEYFFKIISK